MAEQPTNTNILGLTAKVVAAHVANNTVSPTEVQSMIRQIYQTLSAAGNQPTRDRSTAKEVAFRLTTCGCLMVSSGISANSSTDHSAAVNK